jgi:hypothetical protein
MGSAPNWFLSLLWIPLCNQDLLSDVSGEASPSIGSTGLLEPCGMLSQQAREAKSWQQGGENTISSESQMNPHKCYRNLEHRHGTPRLFRKQYLLVCQQWLS